METLVTPETFLHGAKDMSFKYDSFRGTVMTPYSRPLNDGSGSQMVVAIRCTKKNCDEMSVRPTGRKDLNVDEFIKYFSTHENWRISGLTKAVCPTCQGRKPLPRELEPEALLAKSFAETPVRTTTVQPCEEATAMNTIITQAPTGTPVTAPVDAVKTAPPAAKTTGQPLKRSDKVHLAEMYLDSYFVVIGKGYGYYMPDANDAAGAAEAQLTEEEFRTIREDDYGMLLDVGQLGGQIDTAILHCETAVQTLSDMVDDIQKQMLKGKGMPEDLKAAKVQLEAQIESKRRGVLERFERCKETFEQDFDNLLVKLRGQIDDEMAKRAQMTATILAPKAAELTTQFEEVNRGLAALRDLKTKLPAGVLGA